MLKRALDSFCSSAESAVADTFLKRALDSFCSSAESAVADTFYLI